MKIKISPENIKSLASTSNDGNEYFSICDVCRQRLDSGWDDDYDRHTLNVCLANLRKRIEALEAK